MATSPGGRARHLTSTRRAIGRRRSTVLAALVIAASGACSDSEAPPADDGSASAAVPDRSTNTANATSTTIDRPGTAPTTSPDNAPRALVARPGATGGDGSPEAPFGDLMTALESLRPGDTLQLHGGVYEQRVRAVVTPATATEPIIVEPVPGERPLIEGLLWVENPSYWSIRGLDVTWSDENDDDEHMVKITGGTGWELVGAEIWGARSYAAILVAGAAADFRLAHLFVHDTHESNGRNQDHLIYLNSGDGGGVVEHNVLARSENGRAIKLGGADRDDTDVANIVIRNNTMIDNLGPSNIQMSYSTSNIRIERNILVRPRDDGPAITGFRFDGDGIVVADNIYWEASSAVDDELAERIEQRGNRRVDPRFADEDLDDFRPLNAAAQSYGAFAPTASIDRPSDD